MITGCGHGGVLNLLDYARRTFAGGEHIHAIYGGLHLSPLEDWDNQRDEIVKALAGLWHRQDRLQPLHGAYGRREDAGQRLAGTAGNSPKRVTDRFVPG